MSDIYNKNAREKALLEEAYRSVYNEAQPAWPPKVHKEGAVDVELESWWEYDPHDVVLKVYHGALHALPPAQGTPEYERNFEKIFTWLEGKYPQHSEDTEDKEHDEYHPGYGKVEDGEEHEMEFDERGFAKNTKAGKEDEDAESREERADVDKYEYEQGKEAGEREDHDKGVKMAHEALEMFKDELHVGGHPEDVNVNELADAHDQLSRALHWLLDETDVEYIIGGRATQRSEAQSQPEQWDGPGMQWDNIEI